MQDTGGSVQQGSGISSGGRAPRSGSRTSSSRPSRCAPYPPSSGARFARLNFAATGAE